METFIGNILAWAIGAFAVATWLMWWFTTSLPQHLFNLASVLGYRKGATEFWTHRDPEIGYAARVGDLTQGDWTMWLNGKFGQDHPKLAQLFQCPGCMSGQASLWLSVAFALLMWHWLWVPVGLATWPAAGRILARAAADV